MVFVRCAWPHPARRGVMEGHRVAPFARVVRLGTVVLESCMCHVGRTRCPVGEASWQARGPLHLATWAQLHAIFGSWPSFSASRYLAHGRASQPHDFWHMAELLSFASGWRHGETCSLRFARRLGFSLGRVAPPELLGGWGGWLVHRLSNLHWRTGRSSSSRRSRPP